MVYYGLSLSATRIYQETTLTQRNPNATSRINIIKHFGSLWRGAHESTLAVPKVPWLPLASLPRCDSWFVAPCFSSSRPEVLEPRQVRRQPLVARVCSSMECNT